MDAEDDEEDEIACNVTESDDLLAKIFDHSQSVGPVPHDAPDSEEIHNWMEPPSNHFIPLVMTQLPFDPAEKLVLST